MDALNTHPYYPIGARVVDYTPNETSVLGLLSTASLASTALLGATWLFSIWARPNLKIGDRIAILWFVLCMNHPGAFHT